MLKQLIQGKMEKPSFCELWVMKCFAIWGPISHDVTR